MIGAFSDTHTYRRLLGWIYGMGDVVFFVVLVFALVVVWRFCVEELELGLGRGLGLGLGMVFGKRT